MGREAGASAPSLACLALPCTALVMCVFLRPQLLPGSTNSFPPSVPSGWYDKDSSWPPAPGCSLHLLGLLPIAGGCLALNSSTENFHTDLFFFFESLSVVVVSLLMSYSAFLSGALNDLSVDPFSVCCLPHARTLSVTTS